MSSDIVSARDIAQTDASLSDRKDKSRKRRHSELSDLDEEQESSEVDVALSTSAKISSLTRQVLHLQQLLQNVRASQSSKEHPCPAPSCTKGFERLQHLNRHIRIEEDETHKELAKVIDETWCARCAKDFSKPTGLVKHERKPHCEVYMSRLDKVAIRTGLPSPPPDSPIAVNDEICRQAPLLYLLMRQLTPCSDEIGHAARDGMPASHPSHQIPQSFEPLGGQSLTESVAENQGRASSDYFTSYDGCPSSASPDPSTTTQSYQHPQIASEQPFVNSPPPITTTAMPEETSTPHLCVNISQEVASDSQRAQILPLTVEILEVVLADLKGGNGHGMSVTLPFE